MNLFVSNCSTSTFEHPINVLIPFIGFDLHYLMDFDANGINDLCNGVSSISIQGDVCIMVYLPFDYFNQNVRYID